MKQNAGILDTAVRSVVACVLLTLAIEGIFTTGISIFLGVISMLLWVSSSFGVCLLYKALGIDTYPNFSDDSYHAH